MTYESSSAASDVILAPFGLRIIRATPSAARGETAESVAKRSSASAPAGYSCVAKAIARAVRRRKVEAIAGEHVSAGQDPSRRC